MPFLVGQAVVVLVDVVFRLALDNQPNAWEDEEGGKSLRAFEDCQAYEHADRNRDQGLEERQIERKRQLCGHAE